MIKSDFCKPPVSWSRSAKPVGTPTTLAPVLLHVVDLIEEAVRGLRRSRRNPWSGASLGDVEDRLLGGIQRLLGIDPFPVADADNHRAGIDQAAQGRGPLDDAAVVLDVDGGRHRVEEGRQIGDAADLLQPLTASQLVGEGDEVGRFPPVVEVEDGVVDRAVAPGVEVVRP